jgi:hypothetical protein
MEFYLHTSLCSGSTVILFYQVQMLVHINWLPFQNGMQRVYTAHEGDDP